MSFATSYAEMVRVTERDAARTRLRWLCSSGWGPEPEPTEAEVDSLLRAERAAWYRRSAELEAERANPHPCSAPTEACR